MKSIYYSTYIIIGFLLNQAHAADMYIKIENPIHLGTGLKFGEDSSEGPICQSLGFDNYLTGHKEIEYCSSFCEIVDINWSGKVTDIRNASSYVSAVYCGEFKGNANKKELSIAVKNPTHPISNLNFDGSSSEEGVCRALGYSRGVVESKITDLETKETPTIVVDSDGSIIKAVTPSDRARHMIKSVVCLLVSQGT